MPHTTPCLHAHGHVRAFPRDSANRLALALAALTAFALVVGTAVVGSAHPAYAHASLVSSDPDEGSTLDAAPTEVTLTFNEVVREPAFVVITAPDGKQQELDKPTIDGEVVTQALDPDTEAAIHPGGAWTLAYRVVSDDGHTVQGHVRFRVTGEAPSPTTSTTDADGEEESTTSRPNGNDSEDRSTNAVLVAVVVGLAVVLATAALVRSRRNRA